MPKDIMGRAGWFLLWQRKLSQKHMATSEGTRLQGRGSHDPTAEVVWDTGQAWSFLHGPVSNPPLTALRCIVPCYLTITRGMQYGFVSTGLRTLEIQLRLGPATISACVPLTGKGQSIMISGSYF